jgi:hypothetical protein
VASVPCLDTASVVVRQTQVQVPVPARLLGLELWKLALEKEQLSVLGLMAAPGPAQLLELAQEQARRHLPVLMLASILVLALLQAQE